MRNNAGNWRNFPRWSARRTARCTRASSNAAEISFASRRYIWKTGIQGRNRQPGKSPGFQLFDSCNDFAVFKTLKFDENFLTLSSTFELRHCFVFRHSRASSFSFMHRFYIAPEDWNADALVLRESEVHHARDVLRLEPGERVVVFNGRGHEITAVITKVTREEIQLRKLHQARVPPLRCEITLAQAIPKGKNMDLIVQKAVELGVAAIAPLLSERTVIQFEADEAAKKQAKWREIAIEAAKQCGQNWLPEISPPRAPKDFFRA